VGPRAHEKPAIQTLRHLVKLMQQIRYLDKLVGELAKGKTMNRILRKQWGSDPVAVAVPGAIPAPAI
jgi:TPP-dependent pyruvate/acetoin dehydrogenase alpha subunit